MDNVQNTSETIANNMGWLKDICERYTAGKNIYDVLVGGTDVDSGREMIVSPANLGDTVFLASLAEAYKKAHNIDTLILVAKKRQAEAAEWFSGIDSIVGLGDTEIILLRYYFTISRNHYSNGIRYGHIPCILTPQYPGTFFHVPPGFAGDSLMHIWERILDVPKDSPTSGIVIPPGINIAPNRAEEYSNAVLIAPAAFTNKGIPESFWEKLTETLLDMGYDVYCNNGGLDYDKRIKGTKSFDATTKELILYAPLFKHVVSVRSGFTDLVSKTEAKLTVLHLNGRVDSGDIRVEYGTRGDDVRDLGRMEGIYPLIWDPQREDEAIGAILEDVNVN